MINRLSSHLFLTGAEKYFDAAKSVCKPPDTEKEKSTCKASFPAYFLVGRSIELALKAFLYARGVKIKQLKRRYGHDLTTLITDSRRRKLGNEVRLTQEHIAAVKLLNFPYKEKLLEYSEVGTYTLPHYWVICEVAYKLVAGLKPYCYKSTFNKEFPALQKNKMQV